MERFLYRLAKSPFADRFVLKGVNPASIEVSRIKEDADYEGVRVRFHGTLAKARILMQIDIAFGDVVVPHPFAIEYPTLLESTRARGISQRDRRASPMTYVFDSTQYFAVASGTNILAFTLPG